MKSKKQMRNIFIKKIDDILIKYYKEMDFNLLATPDYGGEYRDADTFNNGEAHCKEAMELIELMWELDLINKGEYALLREVYREYFSLHRC